MCVKLFSLIFIDFDEILYLKMNNVKLDFRKYSLIVFLFL